MNRKDQGSFDAALAVLLIVVLPASIGGFVLSLIFGAIVMAGRALGWWA